MKAYNIVIDMLKNGDKGVLVTIMAGTPSILENIEKHLIWLNGRLILVDKNGCNTALDLNSTLFSSIKNLSDQVLKTRKFHREKLQIGEEWVDLMLEPILPRPRLIVFGCGFVGQALAQMVHLIELPLTVVDDRPQFANSDIFPEGTRVICDDFSRAIEEIDVQETDFVVIVTRGHQYDRICMEKMVGKTLAYIGMIGSKRRVRGLFEELEKSGVDPEWLANVHSPIGLKIGAETPAEIGVSILAEIIQVWRKGEQS